MWAVNNFFKAHNQSNLTIECCGLFNGCFDLKKTPSIILIKNILEFVCVAWMTTSVEVVKDKPTMSHGASPSLVLEPKCCVLRPDQDAWSFQLDPLTPLLKLLDRLVFVSKETVSIFQTLVPRQTSPCGWQLIVLGPFLDKFLSCGYHNLFRQKFDSRFLEPYSKNLELCFTKI